MTAMADLERLDWENHLATLERAIFLRRNIVRRKRKEGARTDNIHHHLVRLEGQRRAHIAARPKGVQQ